MLNRPSILTRPLWGKGGIGDRGEKEKEEREKGKEDWEKGKGGWMRGLQGRDI